MSLNDYIIQVTLEPMPEKLVVVRPGARYRCWSCNCPNDYSYRLCQACEAEADAAEEDECGI